MSGEPKQLRACLARYMDPAAFTTTIPPLVKHTCKNVSRVEAEKLRVRREIANKRARAAIRFFEKPENFARLSRRMDGPA